MAELSGFTKREIPGLPSDLYSSTIVRYFNGNVSTGYTWTRNPAEYTTFEYLRGYSIFEDPRDSGNIIVNNLIVDDDRSSYNKDTGALVVTNGGVGIQENLNVGDNITVGGNISISGITTIGLGVTSAPSNSQLTFELTSNTNLRIKVRGTDGVLRSADITLA